MRSVLLSACAARTPPRPAGAPTPDPAAIEAFSAATAACKGFRSIEGELSLSGRAGNERVRGRILAGLESGGAVRLEAVAPFGAPFFVLAGRAERATLVLPREHRVLKDTAVRDVLERITGLSLGADDLRLIVSGMPRRQPVADRRPPVGRRLARRDDRSRSRRVSACRQWSIGADRRRLRPVACRLFRSCGRVPTSGESPRAPAPEHGDAGIDITARIEQLQVNTQINPRAWTVDVPSDADPMTLDELRSIAPLAEKK